MHQVTGEIKFGTDGWRGVISDNFTFVNVRRLAQAIADYYNPRTREPANPLTREPANSRTKIAVGYDTRFLSEKYAQAAAEIFAQSGIEVIISDRPIPTPTLSFAVKKRGLDAGVMITASHNPAEYNGIKIKTSEGGAAGVEVTDEVEKLLYGVLKSQSVPACPAGRKVSGKIKKVDLTGDYINFLRRYIDLKKLKNAKFRILVDAMHGSGNGFIAEVLKGTKIKVEFTRKDINPSFGGLRPEPVLENLLGTRKIIKQGKFDICLVLDGDADRIAAFTGGGEFINPQKVLGLLILHLICDRKMSGAVVKTIVGTNMLDNIAGELGLKLNETPVGFKYISELMIKGDVLVGGEEAGGIGFKNYIPERDGTLAGLLLLEMMSYRRKPIGAILKEMEKRFGRYYYLRDDLKLKGAAVDVHTFKNIKKLLGKDVAEVKDYDGVKLICSDKSWLMFRGSGTEPIMRVYAESKSLSRSKKLLALGRGLVLRKNAL